MKIRAFYARFSLAFALLLASSATIAGATRVSNPFDDMLYEEACEQLLLSAKRRLLAVDQVVDWIENHGGAIPGTKDFRDADGNALPPINLLLGHYKGKAKFFTNASEAWLAIRERAAERGVRMRLYDIDFKKPATEEFHIELRKEIVRETADWVLRNKRLPLITDWGFSEGRLRMNWDRLFSKSSSKKRPPIFEFSFDFWIEVQRACAKSGFRVSLLDIKSSKDLTPERRDYLQADALETVRPWLMKHKRVPVESDFQPVGELALDYARFFALDLYREGKRERHRRIFDDEIQAYRALFGLANELGIRLNPFELERNSNRYAKTLAFIAEKQRDFALAFLAGWSRANKRYPKREDFGDEIAELGIPADRLFGLGRYKATGDLGAIRVFDSREAMLESLRVFMSI